MPVFGDRNFRGEAVQLTSPTFAETFETMRPPLQPDLRNVDGQTFLKRMQSLTVGPHARLIAYEGQQFTGEKWSSDRALKRRTLPSCAFMSESNL
jgi:hypothetical protein